MQTLKMKLADMNKPEKNVRNHTERQLQEYERSVRMFGQIRPIVVDENNEIMIGVGLYDTLVRLGYEEADVYQLVDLTPAQKKKLMIADNKIFNLGVENLEVLNEFIEELKDDLDIPGFDEDILKEMVADAEEVTETIMGYGKLDEEEIKEIRDIGEKQEEKAERIRLESKTPENGSMQEKKPAESANRIINDNMDDEKADVQKFVVCPKCGEKIWL